MDKKTQKIGEIPGCKETRTIFIIFDGICDRAYDNS
jgi:hypothetical protein